MARHTLSNHVTTNIPSPPSPGQSGGLGEKVSNTLQHFLIKTFETLIETFVAVGAAIGEKVLDFIAPSALKIVVPVLDELSKAEGTPRWFKNFADEIKRTEGKEASILGAVGMIALSTILADVLRPVSTLLAYGIEHTTHTARPDPATMARLAWRRDWDWGFIKESMRDLGWADGYTEAFFDTVRPRPSERDLIAYEFLVKESTRATDEELAARGWTPEDIKIIRTVAKSYPSPSDLIRFGLREAWDEEVCSKWGYNADFPQKFKEWMERLGFDPEWALLYWRAHWQIPSPTMGYEMFHRGIISREELEELLRINDYPAGWRERLVKLSYTPITRVDIRRLYKLGIIRTPEELVRRYMDIGYSEDDARALAEFTIKEYVDKERELTKSEIVKAYKLGRFSREEAKNYLTKIDYSETYAEILLDTADFDLAEDRAREIKKHVKTLFISGQYDERDVHIELGKAGFTADEIERCIEQWTITKKAKVGRPSKTDLRRFFLKAIINEDELRKELEGHRLSDKYIDWYVSDLKQRMVEEAREEEEKAAKERERIRRSKLKTEYDVEASEIDLTIAQYNKAIADLTASIEPDTPEEIVTEVAELIDDYKALIAEEKVKKAELRRRYLEEKRKGE